MTYEGICMTYEDYILYELCRVLFVRTMQGIICMNYVGYYLYDL